MFTWHFCVTDLAGGHFSSLAEEPSKNLLHHHWESRCMRNWHIEEMHCVYALVQNAVPETDTF